MLDFGAPTDIFLRFFGRTDLRIGAFRAKKCEGLDFEVSSCEDPPKSAQKGEKRCSRPKMFAQFFLFAENWNVGDRLKLVLAKFRADLSHVRGRTKKIHLSSTEGNTGLNLVVGSYFGESACRQENQKLPTLVGSFFWEVSALASWSCRQFFSLMGILESSYQHIIM